MKAGDRKTIATFTLRLLLDQSFQSFDIGDERWHELLGVAVRNFALLRVAKRLRELAYLAPPFFSEAEENERQRVQGQLDLIAKISQVCSASGIEFIFPKAFQHYPDAGHDLDLFVLTKSTKVDALLVETFKAAPLKRSFRNRLDGSVCYKIPEYKSPLDIHHRRLGNLGEHSSLLETIFKNSKETITIVGKFLAPSREDQMILQAMQRVYGRRYIRLSDIIFAISLMRRGDLDWDYLIKSAKQLGIFHGLCCYLAYVDQIHSEVFRGNLLSSELKRVLILDGWGRIEFKDRYYTFPNLRVASWLYSKRLQSALGSGDFGAAGRLCMTPFVALACALRKTSHGRNRTFLTGRTIG
jgi:hypothetical protein